MQTENNDYKSALSKKDCEISGLQQTCNALNQKIYALIKDLNAANTMIEFVKKKEEERQLETEKTQISFEKAIVDLKEEFRVLTNKQNLVILDLNREKKDLEIGVIERESRIRDLEAKLAEESLKNENLEERVVFVKQENDCIEPRLAEMASTLSQEFFQKENEQKQKLENAKRN